MGDLCVRHPEFYSLPRNHRVIEAGRDLQGHPVPPRTGTAAVGPGGSCPKKAQPGEPFQVQSRLRDQHGKVRVEPWRMGQPSPGPGSKTLGWEQECWKLDSVAGLAAWTVQESEGTRGAPRKAGFMGSKQLRFPLPGHSFSPQNWAQGGIQLIPKTHREQGAIRHKGAITPSALQTAG